MENRIKVDARTKAPEGVDGDTAARLEEAIAESFVGAFRLNMVAGMGLALASALVALMISPQHPTPAKSSVLLHALIH